MSINIFDRENNNFDIIRLIASLMVIYAHSYAIAPKEGKMDLVTRLTGITHAGEIAVFIFMFLSGALVFKSMEHSLSMKDFITKRFFRIYPPLVVCIIFCVSLGLIFTDLTIINYLKDPQLYKYILGNLKLIWNEHFLPGVFTDHPNQGVNGSLWSITLEARLYIMVGMFGMFGLLKYRDTANIVIIFLIFGVLTFPNLMPLVGSNQELFGLGVFPQYTITFLIGGLIYYNNKNFIMNYGIVVCLLIVTILTSDTSLHKTFIMLFSIALAYQISTSKTIIKFRLKEDISYGVYLYGWPMAQVVYKLLPKVGPEINTILSCILTIIVAKLSWKYIEKPAIRFSRDISKKYFSNSISSTTS